MRLRPVGRFTVALTLGTITATLLLLVVVFPVLYLTYLSFTGHRAFTDTYPFVGLQNYEVLLRNTAFLHSLRNTATYAVGSMAGQVVFGTAVALLVACWPHHLQNYIRALLFTPYVIVPTAVVAQTWRLLGDSKVGLLPGLFAPDYIPMTLIAVSVWCFAPFTMMLVMARIDQIPRSHYDIVALDGGGRWAAFRHVILPHITNTIAATALLRLIIMATKFDLPYLLLGSGLASTRHGPVSIFLFEHTYERMNYGEGCAGAVLVCLALVIPMAVALRGRVLVPA